jgi:hypothetical protein
MEQFFRRLLEDPIQFWNTVFGVLGVVTGLIGVVSWWEGKRSQRVYKYLLEVAERNIDRSVTEQELQRKRAEVETATTHIEQLQDRIRRDIPLQARRAVLQDRLNSQIELLAATLESTKRLQSELNHLAVPTGIPPDLLRAIEAEIRPEYVVREKRSSLQTALTILTATSAILSTLLPYPVNRAVAWPLLVAALPILFFLTKVSLPRHRSTRRRLYRRVGQWALAVVGVILMVSGFGLTVIGLTEFESVDVAATLTGVGLMLFGLVSWGLVFFLRRRARNRDAGHVSASS